MMRIVDANLNRIGEGLRVLEDIARFTLDDTTLSHQLKTLRHSLLPTDPTTLANLTLSRDSASDVGAFLDAEGEGRRSGLTSIVGANAHRVQQSLRVLEEVCKTGDADCGLDWNALKHARFELYEIEKSLGVRLLRRDRLERLRGLYLIVDAEALGDRSALELTRAALSEGVRAVQMRDKAHSKAEMLGAARGLSDVCREAGALLIINDDLDIALACDADGLHLGQHDLPIPEARRLLPQDSLVGCSTATVEEARQAQEDGADYVAVGSMYRTSSKEGTRAAGLETLRTVREAVSLHLVAIGGINENNVSEVVDAGADAVAVIGAVLGAPDPAQAIRRIISRIEGG